MRVRTLSIVGLSAAALVLSTMATASATAADGAGVPLRASAVASDGEDSTASVPVGGGGKCRTGYGALTDPEDGIIAWNSTDGSYNNGGAADFTCKRTKRQRTIKSVAVWGYFGSGTGTDTFNVTFYANDPAGGSDEADDSGVLCDYTLPGASGGPYPGGLETTFDLTTAPGGKCVLTRANRHAWVRVQNVNPSGPWYWQVTTDQKGAPSDWRDVAGTFTTLCPLYNNDKYLSHPDCLGYPYPEWQLKLG